MRAVLVALLALFLLALAAIAACADPIRDASIDALGPEDPGVAVGPLHRAGQPCLTCHDGKGEARAMTIAGTVYRTENESVPVNGVDVIVTDSAHHTFITKTNCAGNFFAYREDFAREQRGR